MAVPVSPGVVTSVARTGWSVVKWLRDRGEEQEILLAAIARAICPGSPEQANVRALADRIQRRLWERLPKRPDLSVADRGKEFVRVRVRRLEPKDVAWPYWRSGLSATLTAHGVVTGKELDDTRRDADCFGVHGTLEDFVASVPVQLIEELAVEDKMTDLRCEMLDRLWQADQLYAWLEARKRPSTVRTTAAGIAGGVTTVAGVEAITNAPTELSLVAGAVVAGVTAVASQFEEKRSRDAFSARLSLRLHVRRWVGDLLWAHGVCAASASRTELRVAAARFGRPSPTPGDEGSIVAEERIGPLRDDIRARLLPEAREHDDVELANALAEIEDALIRLDRGTGSRAAVAASVVHLLDVVEAVVPEPLTAAKEVTDSPLSPSEMAVLSGSEQTGREPLPSAGLPPDEVRSTAAGTRTSASQ